MAPHALAMTVGLEAAQTGVQSPLVVHVGSLGRSLISYHLHCMGQRAVTVPALGSVGIRPIVHLWGPYTPGAE